MAVSACYPDPIEVIKFRMEPQGVNAEGSQGVDWLAHEDRRGAVRQARALDGHEPAISRRQAMAKKLTKKSIDLYGIWPYAEVRTKEMQPCPLSMQLMPLIAQLPRPRG